MNQGDRRSRPSSSSSIASYMPEQNVTATSDSGGALAAAEHSRDTVGEGVQNVKVEALRAALSAVLQAGLKRTDAQVYEYQLQVAQCLLAKQSVLYVNSTGAGKTESYFAPAKYIRDNDSSAGPVIVVSPTNALLDDQHKRAADFGLQSQVFNGQTNQFTRSDIVRDLATKNNIDILFITPDQLFKFATGVGHPLQQVPQLSQASKGNKRSRWSYVPFIVVDEIDEIYEKGHDFRPVLLQVWDKLEAFKWYKGAAKLGLTATMTKRALAAIQQALPGEWQQVQGELYRANLKLHIVPNATSATTRWQWVEDHIQEHSNDNVIVFCQYTKECDEYANKFKALGINVHAFYAGIPDRSQVAENFKSGKIRVLLTSNALSRGYNKRDVQQVIYTYTPSTMTEYYQGIGRAGRDGSNASVYLLPTVPWFKEHWVNALWRIAQFVALHPNKSASLTTIRDMMNSKNVADKIVEDALTKGLARGDLIKESSDGVLLSNDYQARLERLSEWQTGHNEDLKAMLRFTQQGGCQWQYILQELGRPSEEQCGSCYPQCDSETDITMADAFAGDGTYYEAVTKGGFTVIALGEPNDVVDQSSDRLRILLLALYPDMAAVPAQWSVSCIPDSKGAISAAARVLASITHMDFFEYIENTGGLSMVDAKTSAQQTTVLTKYKFHSTQMPAMGKVLLYDDVANTGTTIDHVAPKLQAQGLEVVVIVTKGYPTLGFEKRSVNEQ